MLRKVHTQYSIVGLKSHPGHEGEPCAYGTLVETSTKKRVCMFHEDGHGGPMAIDPLDVDAWQRFAAYVRDLRLTYTMGEEVHEVTFERNQWVIGEIISDTDVEKQLKRACKRAVCFQLKSDPPDVHREIKCPESGRDLVIARVRAKYGTDLIVVYNEQV